MKVRTAMVIGAVGCLAWISQMAPVSGQTGAPSESEIGHALRPAPNLGEHQGLPTFGSAPLAPENPNMHGAALTTAPQRAQTKTHKSRAIAAAAPAAAPPAAGAPSISFNSIQFTFNSAQLTPNSIETLQNLGKALNHELADQKSFLIEGHTDAKGGRAYNMTLSRRRADAVKDFLVHQAGVDPSRLKTVGKGATEPVSPADPYAADNRRVVVKNLGG
jgi:OmpA-OmpF porin, OOP family